MNLPRLSGVLLHPTSLPNAYGIGSIGQAAFDFIRYLQKAGFGLWQVLPLGPTSYGDSPYSAMSTFATSPYLIDIDILKQKYSLPSGMVKTPRVIKHAIVVDYGRLFEWKMPLLKKIATYILDNHDRRFVQCYSQFLEKSSYWLSDWATFISIKDYYDKKAKREHIWGKDSTWGYFWDEDLRKKEANAISKWQQEHKREIEIAKCIQFLFDEQWQDLREFAKEHNVKLIGDIPIFCAEDSSDVWGNQELFMLDSNAHKTASAGVPPDYFSTTGQLWGNPLYNWEMHEKDGFSWWKNRIKRCLELCDFVRIDHFRGLEAFWAIPSGNKTAEVGQWLKAPGAKLLTSLQETFGDLPIIAEDLGVITKEVEDLRDSFNLAGMKVLQFAFNAQDFKQNIMTNAFLPHNHKYNAICYTGTHDNDTLQGYLSNNKYNPLGRQTNALIANYLTGKRLKQQEINALIEDGTLATLLIKTALQSTCAFSIIPLQDILGLGSFAQMNRPSTQGGNWVWRFTSIRDLYSTNVLLNVKELFNFNRLYGRLPL